MSAVNINEQGYHRRLEAVRKILSKFKLEVSEITTLEYVDHCPFPFNNFLYKVQFTAPAKLGVFPSTPGADPVPEEGVSTVVIRLSNPQATGLNNAHRIQNEVAAASLVRDALPRHLKHLVPVVFAWQAYRPQVEGEEGFGWTIAEFCNGVNLDSVLWGLDKDAQQDTITQVAELLGALQNVSLPPNLDRYGGLTFDNTGKIVIGQFPLLEGGPFDSYAEVWTARLRQQLQEADNSPLLGGWRGNGVKDRIEKFLAEDGLKQALSGVDVAAKALVHGDLSKT
jgi:hypothetical protein